jgi:DNA modification methylase
MAHCRADMAFLEPPYNMRIGDVVGRGRTKHSEFAMASGEMSSADYVRFLGITLSAAASVSRDGALHYVCTDWRHIAELMAAAKPVYKDTINIAVWVKSKAGQGSFYRSQHEFVGVFRIGQAPHLNNVELERHGRSRSNVWHYAGVNSFRAGRMEELRSHPSAKPVALVADAIKDCTRRGDVALDTFVVGYDHFGNRASGAVCPGARDRASFRRRHHSPLANVSPAGTQSMCPAAAAGRIAASSSDQVRRVARAK